MKKGADVRSFLLLPNLWSVLKADFFDSPEMASDWQAMANNVAMSPMVELNSQIEAQICIAVEEVKKLVVSGAEELRGRMREGLTKWGIPPLEPLHIQKFPFHLYHEYYEVWGWLTDISIHGLSTFNLTRVDTHLLSRVDLDLDIHLGRFKISGNYELHGQLLKIFPLIGSGPFSTRYENISNAFYVKFVIDPDTGRVSVSTLDFRMRVGRLEVNFDGLGGNKIASGFANTVLNMFATALFAAFEPQMRKEVNTLLRRQINLSLKDVRLPEILRNRLGTRVVC